MRCNSREPSALATGVTARTPLERLAGRGPNNPRPSRSLLAPQFPTLPAILFLPRRVAYGSMACLEQLKEEEEEMEIYREEGRERNDYVFAYARLSALGI